MESPQKLQPMSVCESCWLMDHARWEPESMDDTGNILMRLVGVDVPVKVNNGTVEVCCMCGGLSVSGIYEMKDPDQIYFTDSGDDKYELELPEFDLGEDFD